MAHGAHAQQEVLGGRRGAYGAEIVVTLSRQLAADYGRGFEEKSLRRMVQFAEVYPDEAIVVSMTRQLSWTHFLVLQVGPVGLGEAIVSTVSRQLTTHDASILPVTSWHRRHHHRESQARTEGRPTAGSRRVMIIIR